MILTYWGVRGSVPVPGPTTLKFGGNTSCITIERDGHVLIVDAGTGIRALGEAQIGTGREFYLLLTHLHADHLQGFPFFQPLYRAGERVHLMDYRHDSRAFSAIELFDGVQVPMGPTTVKADCECSAGNPLEYLRAREFHVESIALNHPGGALGYRISNGGRSVVHITDNDLSYEDGAATSFDAFVDFCRGADVLSHDAQWTAAEATARRGWGHSSVDDVCRLARAAQVKRLILFHHDPSRTDAQVDAIQQAARRDLAAAGIPCEAAREGLRIDLTSERDR